VDCLRASGSANANRKFKGNPSAFAVRTTPVKLTGHKAGFSIPEQEGDSMNKKRAEGSVTIATMSLSVFALFCGMAAGQNLQGVINGRSGATMTVRTQFSGNVVVLLTPSTEVDEVEGLLKARKKEMGVTALIPGRSVQVQGTCNAQNQLVANTVKFKCDDLKNAEDIQAGVAPTEQLAQANQQQIQQSEQQIQAQKAALQRNRRNGRPSSSRPPPTRARSPRTRRPLLPIINASVNWRITTSWERRRFTSPTAALRSTRSTNRNS